VTEVQSPRAGFCWTQKELTSDLRRMGLAEYLEERPQGSRRLVFPWRGEIVGFDLAANFLDSIVIRVDLMTFQTRDIREYFGEAG